MQFQILLPNINLLDLHSSNFGGIDSLAYVVLI